MCRGDGADDGETESVAVLGDRSARIKPLERLEEAFNFSRRNYWARVGHREEGPVFCRASHDFHVPSDDVMAYGIGEQVDDEPLDHWAAYSTASGAITGMSRNTERDI